MTFPTRFRRQWTLGVSSNHPELRLERQNVIVKPEQIWYFWTFEGARKTRDRMQNLSDFLCHEARLTWHVVGRFVYPLGLSNREYTKKIRKETQRMKEELRQQETQRTYILSASQRKQQETQRMREELWQQS